MPPELYISPKPYTLPEPSSSLSWKTIFISAIATFAVGFSSTYIYFSFFYKTTTSKPRRDTVITAPAVAVKALIKPEIVKIESPEQLVDGDIVRIHFNTNMSEASTTIAFDIPGSGTWLEPSIYEIQVVKPDPETTYTMALEKGSLTKDGGSNDQDIVYTLRSAPLVAVTFIPMPKTATIKSTINVEFNQEVDRVTAEKLFTITPKALGTFSWNENQMTFAPKKLSYQTMYKVSVKPGVEAVRGFASATTTSMVFTTDAEVVKLSVPYFYQQHKNSCEAASLRMALAYYNINTKDLDIVEKFGYSPKMKDVANNVWDDPQLMFVGDVNGTDRNQGYGVYGQPVLKAVKSFGRSGTYETNITPSFLAKAIRNGHPVVLWGYTTLNEPPYLWNTPKGQVVKAFKGEHARVVVGVRGTIDNPLGFYVHDPLTGDTAKYWSTSSLIGNAYGVFGVTNQAVVVF